MPILYGKNLNNSNAIINVEIKRITANINQTLPVVLFAGHDFFSGYVQSLKSLTPNGLSFLGANNEASEGSFIRFRYQVPPAGASDTIRVRANEIPISTLVSNSVVKPFKIKSVNYTVSDLGTINRQFRQNIELFSLGLFGKNTTDSLTPNQFRFDTIKLEDNVNIPLDLTIDGNTGIGINIIPEVNYSIFLSLFIEQ